MQVAYKHDLPFTAVRFYIFAQSADETHTQTCGIDSEPVVHGAVKRRQFFFADMNYKCILSAQLWYYIYICV